MRIPRLVLAGLSGGAGKTILSLAVARALGDRGLDVRPFKKGPDYIDAAWLGRAAHRPCTNLDPHLLPEHVLSALFAERAAGGDVAVIEGNRGLFDGMDVHGTSSTARLARMLAAPVVLVIDATKMTRTVAAIVQGCAGFDPGIRLAGVILNRTAGPRHRSQLTQAIEAHTDVPVLGLLPKLDDPIPERHIGLISGHEHDAGDRALARLGALAEDWLDLDALLAAAQAAPEYPDCGPLPWPEPVADEAPSIGYVEDEALWFYYPENLEALTRAGARLVRLSLLDDAPWPELHGLYLGGGFPETLAERLSANTERLAEVRALAESGMPVYAECGGFMYLGESVTFGERSYPMSGVLPVSTSLCERPQGLGYVEAESELDNPFHPAGTVFTGHEFHYSLCAETGEATPPLALSMRRGTGMLHGRDGMVSGGVFACYVHLHALGAPHWAPNFVRAAAAFRG